MRLKNNFLIRIFIFLAVLLVFSMLFLDSCFASKQEIDFVILEKGDVSGYYEEAYFVVKTEADWVNVWERHTSIRMPPESPPSIDFSRNFVVCAFMGWRPTTGYSIEIERIWTDGERVFVEVAKRGPPEGFAVGEMVTCPYIMVLMDKTDMHFVFQVVDENGKITEHVLTEFSLTTLLTMSFMVLMFIVVTLKVRNYKKSGLFCATVKVLWIRIKNNW